MMVPIFYQARLDTMRHRRVGIATLPRACRAVRLKGGLQQAREQGHLSGEQIKTLVAVASALEVEPGDLLKR